MSSIVTYTAEQIINFLYEFRKKFVSKTEDGELKLMAANIDIYEFKIKLLDMIVNISEEEFKNPYNKKIILFFGEFTLVYNGKTQVMPVWDIAMQLCKNNEEFTYISDTVGGNILNDNNLKELRNLMFDNLYFQKIDCIISDKFIRLCGNGDVLVIGNGVDVTDTVFYLQDVETIFSYEKITSINNIPKEKFIELYEDAMKKGFNKGKAKSLVVAYIQIKCGY